MIVIGLEEANQPHRFFCLTNRFLLVPIPSHERHFPMTTLGSTLRTLRTQQKLTLKQLAARLDVSWEFLGQVERNRVVPSESRIRQLANVLGTNPEYLNLLAGRVPQDILHTLQIKPSILASIRAGR
jgi:DNA-binding XRE family transcriptional regulator